MNTEKNKKIDEILGSLDNCQRAEVPDFFYTRLKAKMENSVLGNRETVSAKRPLILRPVFALTALAAVLIINAFVIIQKDNTTDNDTSTALSDADSFQSMAAEYSLNENTTILFDINQDK